MDGDENNEDVTLSGTPGHSTISDTITVEELDRRQYENDLELVRIELESKKLQLESQKEKVCTSLCHCVIYRIFDRAKHVVCILSHKSKDKQIG